jgi:multidrug efflux pump subunit AcrB
VFTRFFIDRPIFASVLSIVITLAGGLALVNLPIAMFPQIAPPTVSVTCQYPGASAQVVAETIAAPIEQQVNGVENMMYMSSACTNDGNYTLTVTFKHGVDLNLAQVLVQNRVSLAVPLLPDVIKATGVTTKKRSPDILLSIGLYSPDGRYDQLYLSNYAYLRVRDELARLPGVSDVLMFGQRDYSMRIWLDPDKLAQRGLSAGDVVRALREQNLPVASGQVGQSPTLPGQQTQVTLSAQGRLVEPEQFEKIIVRTTADGRLVRVRDIGRVELGPKNQDMSSEIGARDRYDDPKMDLYPVANLAIFQLPDANALETADIVKAKIEELKSEFPEGIDYMIRYDTTPFIRESIKEVFKALLDSVMLVALVVLLFLQNWRSALIPLIAVPVGIIGTFAVMACFGFSLNNLTLFGLVLAIGIVVDDAIVVVESVEHHIENGMAPRDATIQAMSEVSAPVIAVGLVLSAVFVPCAFISGITGQFFRQFALTIASATVLSTINSLTLSPALAALLLRPREHGTFQALPRLAIVGLGFWQGYEWLGPRLAPMMHGTGLSGRFAAASAVPGLGELSNLSPEVAAGLCGGLVGAILAWVLSGPFNRAIGWFFNLFNRAFTATAHGYSRFVGGMLRVFGLVLLVYAGLLFLTYRQFQSTPRGFIPAQDMGYMLVNVQLPDSAALERTQRVLHQISEIASATQGVSATVGIAGQSLLLNAYGSNFGTMFVTLDEFGKRHSPNPLWHGLENRWRRLWGLKEKPAEPDLYFETIMNKLRGQLAMAVPEATISIFGPPPVRGVGRAGGWMLMIEDRGDMGPVALQAEVENLVRNGNDGIDLRGALISGKTYDLQLVRSLSSPGDLPVQGNRSMVIAEVNGSLYFRVADDRGRIVVDLDEKVLIEHPEQIESLRPLLAGKPPGQGNSASKESPVETLRKRLGPQVDDLRKRVEELWPPHKLTRDESEKVVTMLKAICNLSEPGVVQGLASVFRANVPQVYLDVDRNACMLKGVELRDVFMTLQAYLGSLYVNDFNRFGRTWQVIVQAEQKYRDQEDDISRLQVRNRRGTMVPLGAVARVRQINGPLVLTRYNMYPAASINGSAAPGVSSGSAIGAMEGLSNRELPQSMSFEWTEMAYLELQAGNTAIYVFGFSIVMVFLVLAAQFESWAMPLAVILSVPLCMLSALYGVVNAKSLGVNYTSLDINIFTQIGLVVLVGLASKNSILIVQFAKLIHNRGITIREATLESCRLRLRPIIMTSMAFILGVVPLLFAHGAGAEMRQSLGVAVFSGMLGVTFFGVLLTPVFFYVIDSMAESHVFADPRVRRAARILLMVLVPVVGLRELFRLAGRRAVVAAAKAGSRAEEV